MTLVEYEEESDPSAAAESEIELVRQLRADTGLAPLIGPNGEAALAQLDAIEEAFAAELIRDVASAIDAGTIPQDSASVPAGMLAAIGVGQSAPDLALNAIDVSLFADTGFTASAIMSLYLGIIERAAESRSGTLPRQEHFDQTDPATGLRQVVDLSTTFTVQTGGGRVSADVIMSATDNISNAETGSFVALYTSTSTGHFDVNACPDEFGIAEGTYTFETKHELNDVSSPQAARSAAGRSVEAPFRLLDGEDAYLLLIEASLSMEADGRGPGSPSGPGPTSPFDWGATQAVDLVMPASGGTVVTGIGMNVTGTGGQAAGGAMFISSAMAQLFMQEVAKEAQRFWRSGDCIEINTSHNGGTVSKGETVEFEAEAVGMFDEQQIDAPIKGDFSGVKSFEPIGAPQDPPASFTFNAGDEEGDTGNVKLEQVGVRGIGRKTLEFVVGPTDYKFDHTAPGFGGMRGQKCDTHEGAWTIDASGSATPGTITFTIPPGGTTAQAHALWNLNEGGATVHWDLSGPVSFVKGDPPKLSFGALIGTATVKVAGITQNIPTKQIPFDLPLEQGDFCS